MNDVDKIICIAEWVLKNAIVKIKELNYNAGKINLAGLHPICDIMAVT